MAKYCVEKFEREEDGLEKKVCWRQDKHIHDAKFITTIEKELEKCFTGKWQVRAGSYQYSLQSCPSGSIDYEDL